jgi:hypothetical protein
MEDRKTNRRERVMSPLASEVAANRCSGLGASASATRLTFARLVIVEIVDLRQEAARLRRRFADQLESLDVTAWNSASWCEGWRVRDEGWVNVGDTADTAWQM